MYTRACACKYTRACTVHKHSDAHRHARTPTSTCSRRWHNSFKHVLRRTLNASTLSIHRCDQGARARWRARARARSLSLSFTHARALRLHITWHVATCQRAHVVPESKELPSFSTSTLCLAPSIHFFRLRARAHSSTAPPLNRQPPTPKPTLAHTTYILPHRVSCLSLHTKYTYIHVTHIITHYTHIFIKNV